MKNFKAQIQRDLTNVFHNSMEHADMLTFWIDGIRYQGPVILDSAQVQDRSKRYTDHVEGLNQIDLVMYVPLSVLKKVPGKGHIAEVGGDAYTIDSVREEAGEIVLELERMTE